LTDIGPSTDPYEPPDTRRHRAGPDLIAESMRIRRECSDFVRRYQEALGVRADPRRAPPEPREPSPLASIDERERADAASRRKALLLLLIEELV
jgi:hypothetical protein